MSDSGKYNVQTTHKSFNIIEVLIDRESAGVTDLADELDMSKSIVHNHLSTLEERGYVINENGSYHLTLKFLQIGGLVRDRLNIYNNGKAEIRKLADDTGEVVNLGTEELGKCTYLYVAEGDQAINMDLNFEGGQEHLHSTGLGKAMLAHFPKERVDNIINCHGMQKNTENTIVDRENLAEELERTRARGYAVDDEESISGLRCVAAPIKDQDGEVLGAVSISGPAMRLQGKRWEEELPERILKISNILELSSQNPIRKEISVKD